MYMVITMDNEIYTPDELAERWRITPQIVRRMLRNNEIVGFRLRGLWRVRRDEVERYERRKTAEIKKKT